MTDDPQRLAREGIRFFGEISASISHEMKNVLAIINENAGLLEDMVRMNRKGMPLSSERLVELARSIARQVSRGDRIVRGMNRFAHSADHQVETVDVGELLHFLSNLTARLVAMRGEAARIEVPAEPLTAVTDRFFMEDLVWACWCRAMTAGLPDQPLSIVADRSADTVRIRFHGLAAESPAGKPAFPSPREAVLARHLGAQLQADRENGDIVLILPCCALPSKGANHDGKRTAGG
jgi:light-regulated signal transduction histidine kinase (bacteriophytochrome)